MRTENWKTKKRTKAEKAGPTVTRWNMQDWKMQDQKPVITD